MRLARDSKTGDIVSAEEYLGRYGLLPKKEKPPLHCPHEICQSPVYVSDSKAVHGFIAAGQEVTNRPRKKDGFSHNPNKASKDCPEYYPNDPRFEDLRQHTTGKEVVERNRKILIEDDLMRRRNRLVLDKMLERALKRVPTRADHEKLIPVANKILTTEALTSNPFLYPYMIMAMSDHHRNARTQVVAYVPNGRQELKYSDNEGTQRVEVVPRELQLSFVNKRGHRVSFKPMINPTNSRPVNNFEISYAAWAKLAGVDLGKVMPPTPSTPPVSVTIRVGNHAGQGVKVDITGAGTKVIRGESRASCSRTAKRSETAETEAALIANRPSHRYEIGETFSLFGNDLR